MSVSLVVFVISMGATKAKPAEVKPAPAPAKVEQKQEPTRPAERLPIGIGANVKLGLLVPTSRLSPFVVVGVEVRERLPVLRRMLGIALEFDYFEPRLSGSGTSANLAVGNYSYSGSARAFELAVDAMFFVPLSLPVDLYAALGYAAFFYQTSETAFGTTTRENEVRHGLRVRAGVLWPFFRPLYASFEFLYHWAQFAFAITGPVNAGAVCFNLNIGFEL